MVPFSFFVYLKDPEREIGSTNNGTMETIWVYPIIWKPQVPHSRTRNQKVMSYVKALRPRVAIP